MASKACSYFVNGGFKSGVTVALHQVWNELVFIISYVCVCPEFPLTRQQHDILGFSCCPLSRVLNVTLADWRRFGFEFHLRSLPSAFSEYMDISRPADYFMTCYTVLTRPNKVETAVHGCNSWFSIWILSGRCCVLSALAIVCYCK